MRNAFIDVLERMAADDPDILLVTGDLGFGVLDDYREKFPGQFYNVGVAEQNMSGIAAGLAMTGHTVLTYSIGNFPTLRCLEQVRNDICYHRADVKIVTIGGGMAYGALGPSHHATEDLAILRALPEMDVVAPGDPVEVRELVPQIVKRDGPVYLRLGRAGEPTVHQDDAEVTFGVPTVVEEGDDVLLLTTGGILPVANGAAETLRREKGLDPAVVSVHTVRPLDADRICDLASSYPVVVTCEEHSRHGGLGGAVAEVLLEGGVSPVFRRFALADAFAEGVGGQEHLREVNGIGQEALESLVGSLCGAHMPAPR